MSVAYAPESEITRAGAAFLRVGGLGNVFANGTEVMLARIVHASIDVNTLPPICIVAKLRGGLVHTVGGGWVCTRVVATSVEFEAFVAVVPAGARRGAFAARARVEVGRVLVGARLVGPTLAGVRQPRIGCAFVHRNAVFDLTLRCSVDGR